jgi:MFS family permease
VLLPFARLACGAFLLYGIGYIVPLLRRDLGISESTAGLHASAVAIGTLVAGLGGERFMLRFGVQLASRAAMFGIGLAGAIVAFAPVVALTLLGAAIFGVTGGILLSWVNHSLSSLGGHRANVALARVNLVGLVAALASPIAIAAVDAVGANGRLAMVLPLPLVAVIEAIYWRRGEDLGPAAAMYPDDRPTTPTGRADSPRGQRLPSRYWRAWLVLVVAVALEFTIVYWGASLIDVRTGSGTSLATTAAAAFLVGMIASRIGLAAGIGTRAPRLRVTSVSLVAVIVGVLVAWQAPNVPISAAGLFLAGLGVGPLYPVGIAFALSLATNAPEAAAARATLATGVALIGAPFLLALTAERVGLVTAWPLVAVVAILAIGVVFWTRADGGDQDARRYGIATREP